MKQQKVQINKSLYDEILRFFIFGEATPEQERRIRDGIEADIDARIRRDYYTTYKTAPTPEARERARQDYLEAAGIPRSFQW